MVSKSFVTVLADAPAANIHIPGATADGIEAQLLNIDPEKGTIATVIHIRAGSTIPAHFHTGGSEAHYVLEGDLVDNGRTYGPGTYLTHAAGIIHGPHTSTQGCKVLTIQDPKISAGASDFNISDQGSRHIGRSTSASSDTAPNETSEALPETQKTAPTEDNPTNPKTT